MIDVLGPEKCRRRTTQENIAIVQQSFETGITVSLVVRQPVISLRKQYQEGSLTAAVAGEQVVSVAEVAATMKQIKELQRLHGKKRWRMTSLKKPLNMDGQKSGYRTRPYCPGMVVSFVSRCHWVSRAQLHVILRLIKYKIILSVYGECVKILLNKNGNKICRTYIECPTLLYQLQTLIGYKRL